MEKRKFFKRSDIERGLSDNFGNQVFPGERESVKTASDESFGVLGVLGTRWQGTEAAAILMNDALTIQVLSQEGFRFFLPAFLLVSFDNLKEIGDYEFFEALISVLEEDYQGDISGFWDRGRRAVCAQVLEAIAQDTENSEMRVKVDQLARIF